MFLLLKRTTVNAASATIIAVHTDLVPNSSLEIDKITVLLLGPIFLTDDLVEKSQTLDNPRFTVEVQSYNGTYINLRVVETLDPDNTAATGVLSITVIPSVAD